MKNRTISWSNRLAILMAIAWGALAGLPFVFGDGDGRVGTGRAASSEAGVLSADIAEAKSDWPDCLSGPLGEGPNDTPSITVSQAGDTWVTPAVVAVPQLRTQPLAFAIVRDGLSRGPPLA
ncbi:hypothetical protein [Hyphomicrobium sp.]|uniref:hypothetical protein n=1 Tax=Hyphomicrobium sp. TaxID=82 RepID=UPI002E316E67|nr:hypothetical protein [Hyphomicrobium sp.]HEX2841060.1 hypothetical protein [Hyphomicrobium sp.]